MTVNRTRRNHFLGSIILQSEGSTHKIFDGQQRLTALTALTAIIGETAILLQAHDPSKVCERIVKDTKVFIKNKAGNRLALTKQDNRYFTKKIKDSAWDGRNDAKSNGFLRILFRELKKYVDKELAKHQAIEEQIEALDQLVDTLFNKLHVAVITIESKFQPSVLFESMNFRGKSLSQTDLLKSIIFEAARKQRKKIAVEKTWASIDDKCDGRIEEFLKIYWTQENGCLVRGRISKHLRTILEPASENAPDVEEYIDHLEVGIKYYNKFVLSKGQSKLSYAAQQSLKVIKTLPNSKVFHPFMLKLALTYDFNRSLQKKNYEALLKAVESFSVRTMICDSFDKQRVENIFCSAINTFSQRARRGVHDVLNYLNNRMPTDTEFERSFLQYQNKSANVCKRLLHQLEATVFPAEPIIDDKKAITLEHIMPKDIKAETGWARRDKYHGQYLWRLGNLTLLYEKLNNTNLGFGYKKRQYKKSRVSLTRQLLDYDEWRKKEIIARQKELAAIAKKAWPREVIFSD